jgi:hypothetical protein
MDPARLPDRVLQNRKLKGEVDTYEALSKLTDKFEIFYNRCASVGNVSKAYERPIDFIILHERLGLLGMEVKGGQIRIGQDGGFEQYLYRSNEWKTINPFDQIKMALRELIMVCKRDGADYWIPDDCCVIFPGTQRSQLTDSPQSLPPGTLCADDLPLLAQIIPSLFSKSRKEQAWERGNFIDMRRRLGKMPEAKRKYGLSSGESKKSFFRTASWSKRVPAPEEDESLGESAKDLPPKTGVNYDPFANRTYVEPPASRIDKPKLRRWEIVVAVTTGIVVFLFILWLFPNSFIHHRV